MLCKVTAILLAGRHAIGEMRAKFVIVINYLIGYFLPCKKLQLLSDWLFLSCKNM